MAASPLRSASQARHTHEAESKYPRARAAVLNGLIIHSRAEQTLKDFKVNGGVTVTASFTVTNTGKVAGADMPQVYLTDAAGDKRLRLLGFERVELKPGESRTVTVAADPRLLARFDGKNDLGQWRIAAGPIGWRSASLLVIWCRLQR